MVRIPYSEHGAKGNTVMESFFGRFKTENESLFAEARNIWELRRIVGERLDYHNRRRRHSTLGNQPPVDYVNDEEILPRTAVALAQPSAQSGAKQRPQVWRRGPRFTPKGSEGAGGTSQGVLSTGSAS